jgi:hypothetical protein
MPLIYNWTFSLNNIQTDYSSADNSNREYILLLLAFLTSHGWSYDGSCNSLAVSATNNIFGNADLIADATAANPKSWVVLKSPEGIVAGLDGSYLGDQSRLWISLAFTGYGSPPLTNFCQLSYAVHRFKPTGGTTTAAPTSTSQLNMTGGVTSGGIFTWVQTNSRGAPVAHHFAITDKGHFWSGITNLRQGHEGFGFFMTLMPLTNLVQHLGKDYPFGVLPIKADLSNTDGPTTSMVNSYCAGWNSSGAVGTINASSLAIGSNFVGVGLTPNPLNYNGELCVSKVTVSDNATTGIGPIGEVADLLVTAGGTTTNMMLLDGSMSRMWQWFLPADRPIWG